MAMEPTRGEKIHLVRHRAWNGPWVDLPAEVAAHPAMLSLEERRMLHWLARDYHAGEGSICDLGAFVGGSAAALASGLRSAGRTGQRVHSYDRHRVAAATWRQHGLDAHRPYPPGGDSLPLMQALLGELDALVEIHSGDFCRQPVPEGPIEILFVDIAKTVDTFEHLVTHYLPKLIPGRSIVVQQDYFHYWPYWDVVAMELLADHFEPLACCEENSALFLNTRQVDAEAVQRAMVASLTPATVVAAIRRAGARWPSAAHRARILTMLRILKRREVLPTSIREVRRAYGRVSARPMAAVEVERAFRGARRARPKPAAGNPAPADARLQTV